VDYGILILRVLHICAGAFWVGAAFAFFLFVQPSLKALGPDGEGAFMRDLTKVRRFPTVILIATLVTVVAGALLYIRNAGGVELWLDSTVGVGFTIGAAAALVSFLLGPLGILPTIKKLEAIGEALMAERRPPTPEESAALGALQARLRMIGAIDLVFLAIAILFMSMSRYLR
jgi:uncharacterized membrane protein